MIGVLWVILLIAAVIGATVLIAIWVSDRSLRAHRRYVPLVVPVRTQAVEPFVRVAPMAPPVEVVAATIEPEPVTATTTQAPVEAVVFHDTRVESRTKSAKYAETVRFRRPSEEPVQLLPGRLEVLSGESRHREIRFVRVPGEPLQLVVGRDPGAPSPRHVALQSSTVSRQHARFEFSDGKWAVANLSQTNPVIVNDEHLTDTSGERTLADGDRIELGEVVLRFREH